MASKHVHARLQIDGLLTIYPNAAGMDIGAEEVEVAIRRNRDPQSTPDPLLAKTRHGCAPDCTRLHDRTVMR